MIKISIDITTLLDQYSARGIGEYTSNLVSCLMKDKSIEWNLIGFLDKKINLDRLEHKFHFEKNVVFHSIGPISNSSVHNLWNSNQKIATILERIKPDIHFCPNLERYVKNKYGKSIVMIHDIIPYTTNCYSTKNTLVNLFKGIFYKLQLMKALSSDAILTTSEFTKNELNRHLDIDKDKVLVTLLGRNKLIVKYNPDEKFIHKTKLYYGIKNDFILNFGGLEKNKNITSLMYAFKKVHERLPKVDLVIISDKFKLRYSGSSIPLNKDAKELIKLAKKLNIQNNVKFIGRVEFNDLKSLIISAKLFVHLSTIEGFGLAVLDSLSCGTPCLISDIPVYRELFDDAAEFIDPKNIYEISNALIKLFEDKTRLNTLSEKALKVASKFDWENTCNNTLERLNLLLNEESNTKTDDRKNEISFVAPFFYPFKGGAENYTLNIAKNLVKEKMSVNIYTSTFEKNQLLYENIRNIKINRSKTLIGGYYSRFYPGLFIKILNIKSRIIHVQGFGFIWQDFCLIIKRFFSRRKIKFICTPHGPFMARNNYSKVELFIKKAYTFIQKFYLNWLYDQIIAVNPAQIKWIHNEYGIDIENIKYLPIGVEDCHFQKDELLMKDLKEKYSIKRGCSVLSYLGRFHEYKGVYDLLQASIKLNKDQINFKLFMMGSDAGEYKGMKKFVIENNLEQNVEILLSPSDKIRNEILNLSNIFVFPSQWEAYGIAMLEAMAHQNAIVTTKTEGGLHLVSNKINGLFYDYGNIHELYLAIIKLIHTPKTLKLIRKNNLDKALTLSWKLVWKEYKQIYNVSNNIN